MSVAKDTKSAAKYTDHGTPSEHCGMCVFFIRPVSCEKVQGRISPKGWCKHFRKRAA